MASVEGLTAVGNLITGTNQATQQQNDYEAKKVAAKQASDLMKAGDTRGAYSTLAAVDPDFAEKIIPQLHALDPNLAESLKQGTTKGELTAQTAFNSNPDQLANTKGKYDVLASKQKSQGTADMIRSDPTSPTGFSKINKVTGTKEAVQTTGGGFTNTDVDSTGKEVTIPAEAAKQLPKLTQQFNKDAKPLVDSINATASSQDLLDQNIPGAQIAEKLKTIRGLIQSGRVPQSFVDQYGDGKTSGILASVDSAITQAKGGGLGPQVRQNMYDLNKALQSHAVEEYDSLLKNRSQQAADNLKIDPFIAKKRFASTGPTQYQQTVDQLKSMPPDVQAAYNYVHDNLASKDPATSQKAKALQQVLNQKFGLK